MKKSVKIISFMLLTANLRLIAQSDVAGPTGHLRVPGYYLGWSTALGSTPGSLDIRNDFNQPILFETNSFLRMIVHGGSNSPTGGRIGIGNNLGTGFTPTARIHVHETGSILGGLPNPFLRFTTNTTGASGTDGYEMGIDNFGFAHLINYEATPISIHTNDGTGGGYFERVRFYDFSNNGFIGIGNSANFTAASQIHINMLGANGNAPANFGNMLRTEGDQTLDNKWQLFTGTALGNATEKGVLLTSNNTPVPLAPLVLANNQNPAVNHFVAQASQGDFIINARGNQTSGGTPGIINERMRVTSVNYTEPNTTGNTFNPYTRVSISSGQIPPPVFGVSPTEIAMPLAMLHMGDPWQHSTGGHRDWMNYGTLVTRQTDLAYFGVRQNEDPQFNGDLDKTEAIIAWGDNPGNSSTDSKLDHLRIIFNAAFGGSNAAGTAGHENGLEVMRFVPLADVNANNSRTVYTGIGDFSINNPLFPFGDPVRKLEILSDKTTAGANGNPQLRLTHDQQNPASPANTGLFSEFHATNLGDLFIETRDNTQVNTASRTAQERFVGIHVVQPNNTLEINSQLTSPLGNDPSVPGSWPGGSGASGLRLTDLTSASAVTPTTVTNGINNTKALSVDKNGDVVLITPVANSNNGISTTSTGVLQLGASCSSATLGQIGQATLTDDRFINLNTHSFNYVDAVNGRVGIGDITNCTVNNTLELSANTANSTYGNTNASGLRFTKLTSASPVLANGTNGVTNTKVLTVDGNGDVVLVTPAGGGGYFQCNAGNPGANLPFDAETNLSNHNFIFHDNGIGSGNAAVNNVGVGLAPTNCTPAAKLEVQQSTNSNNSLGILSTNTDIDGVALKAISNGGFTAPYTRVAGWFESPSTPTNGQVAIFVPQAKGVVDIGFATSSYVGLGNNAGLLNVNGSLMNNAGNFQASDSSLKHNIEPIGSALDKIVRLRPVTFEWDTVRDTLMAGTHAGFIAQEVDRVIPEIVHQAGGMQLFSYSEITPYVVKAIQQQKLSIDSLRSNSGGSVLGNICGGTQNPLTNNYEVPLNSKNFLFSGSGKVGIGDFSATPCSPGANLHISSNDEFTQLLVQGNSSNAGAQTSLVLENDLAATSGTGYYGALTKYSSTNSTTPNALEMYNQGDINIHNDYSGDINMYNYGGHTINVGSVNKTNLPGGTTMGVHGNITIEADAPGFPYLFITRGTSPTAYLGADGGAHGELYLYPASSSSPNTVISSNPSNDSYINNGGYVGIATNTPGVTLDVNGTVRAVSYATSDSTMKTNITPLSGSAMSKVKGFRPVSYEWITKKDTAMYGTQFGFTAQQVETIVPELVKTDSAGKKILSYNGVIAFLTKAMQEQQGIIDSLKASNHQRDSLINALASAINSCCNNNSRYINGGGNTDKGAASVDVELSDADIVVLNQNIPNPFAEQTAITYNIPKSAGSAQILFYDINGRQIKSVDITKKGRGQLNVYANDLTNGVYSYTLIVDGKIIDTKKMVKQQ